MKNIILAMTEFFKIIKLKILIMCFNRRTYHLILNYVKMGILRGCGTWPLAGQQRLYNKSKSA